MRAQQTTRKTAPKTASDADSAVHRAETLLRTNRPADALALLAQACARHPRDARLLTLNGRALLALRRPGPAIGALFLALDLQPGTAATHAALGSALHDAGDLPAALEHSLAAYRIAPIAPHATTLSCILIALGHYAEALAVAGHAASMAPHTIEGLVNRAIALEGLGRFPEAAAAGRRAVAAAPHHAVAQHNLAVTLLGMGQLTPEAWAAYDWRLHLRGTPPWLAATPRWTGPRLNAQDVRGRTVLLHAEQGLGDTLQFVRYAPLVAARLAAGGARVILAVQGPLARLLRTVPGVDHVVAIGGHLPPFDLVCPLLDLPGLFATTLDTIPPPIPYADPRPPWNDGVTALRVGLVWAGSTGFVDDRQRSLPPEALLALAGTPRVQFYNLQQGQTPPAELAAIDLMQGAHDFADTAERIAGLDLVIAVDTAVAHLAATMGKPVWLLSRYRGCWRWLHGRADSPWYPTLRVLRQPGPNAWAATLATLRTDLEALAAAPRIRPNATKPRPAAPRLRACKACGTPSPAIGHVDFNRTCEDRRRPAAPLSGRPVTYHRCPGCALIFTGDFDAWTPDDFRTHIYNDTYLDADPDYAQDRPRNVAPMVAALLGQGGPGTPVLDYGGGNGALAALLRANHGIPAETYDPFGAGALPTRTYPVVTCFEVLEHTPDPQATMREIAALTAPGGLVIASTLLQPPNATLDWWYAAPRNGHLTLHTAESLSILWSKAGLTFTLHSPNLHTAQKA